MPTDTDRFATVERLNRTTHADADFLRKSEDAGRYYQNSPGADPSLLGVRDVILGMVDQKMQNLADRFEKRLDVLERRAGSATRPRRCTGLTWESFKAMSPEQQKSAAETATDFDMATMYFSKSWESIMALESRLIKLEKSLESQKHAANLADAWRGVYSDGEVYARGELSTKGGSLWLSLENENAETPGRSQKWKMISKSH